MDRSVMTVVMAVGATLAAANRPCNTARADTAGAGHVHPTLRMMPVPAGVGVNIHFYKGNAKDLSMLAGAGVGIVRMDVSWGGCEKTPGQYDFSQHDQLISDLERRGIRVLFIIDYGNQHYDKGLAPHSDACRAAYARLCAALARRYAGKKILWELWNEPNIGFWKPKPNIDDYMAWCKAVVPAIRKADPTACIIAPATATIAMPFLEGCFKRGLLDLVDGVSVHPYRSPRSGPETVLREYKRLASLIRRYGPAGRAIPILSGEWGYSTTEMPRALQGKYLPRQWLTNMAYDIPVSIWYDWHDDGRDPKEREHNFGTVTWDYKPKPAYVAMKTLIAELRGYLPAGRIDVGDEESFVVAFRRGGDFKLAVWTAGRDREIDIGPGIKVDGAVDHQGKLVDVPPGPRQPVTDGPRYLTLSPPVPAWVRIGSIQIDPVRGVVAGKADGASITVRMANPTDCTARLALHRIQADGVEGAWRTSQPMTIAPHGSCRAEWRGTVHRRDHDAISIRVTGELDVAGEDTCQLGRVVELPISNPLSMRLAWRGDGALVMLETVGDVPLRGLLVPKIDGVSRQAIPVVIEPPERSAMVRMPDVRLAGVARNVSVRLVDRSGRVLAAVEPMTYELVDAIDAPVGTDAGQRYRLWHEGAPKRKADLKAEVVRAPGDDPPFARAVRIDHDMAAGWCFWQLGPKTSSEICPARPRRIMLWVHGDGSGDVIRCRIIDATGQTFQPDAGKMDFSGWRWMEMSLEGPMGHWGGAKDGVVHLPLRWTSYALQDSTKAAHTGTTYLTGVVVGW